MADILNTHTVQDRPNEDDANKDSFGGMSGAPVCRLAKNGLLRLAAFVTSHAVGCSGMTTADCINSDGTLVK
jgi:dihydroorotate dehydrogenase